MNSGSTRLLACTLALGLMGCGSRPAQHQGDAAPADLLTIDDTDRDGPVQEGPVGDGPVADGSLAATNCAKLAAFSTHRRLTYHPAKQAIFAPALDRVVIVTDPGQVFVIDLFSGKVTLRASNVSQIEWLGQGPQILAQSTVDLTLKHYDLQILSSVAPGSTTVAKNVCAHRAAPDGKRVFLVRDCAGVAPGGAYQHGTLVQLELATAKQTVLRSGVTARAPLVFKDGTWSVFYNQHGTSGMGCYVTTPIYYTATPNKIHTVDKSAVASTAQLLASSVLLFGVEPKCSIFKLRRCKLPGGTCTALGQYHDFGGWGWGTDTPYEVSADGSWVLGATNVFGAGASKLFLIPTDGSSEQLFASDLFPYLDVSAIVRAWTFSHSGKHVVYTHLTSGPTPLVMGLSSKPVSGGAKVTITPKLLSGAYQVSPTREEVVYIEQPAPGVVKRAPLGSGSGATLFNAKVPIKGPHHLPDGRGVLLQQAPTSAKPTELIYVPRTGGPEQVVARWSSNNMHDEYVVDPSSCALIFDSDLYGGGTFMATLPTK